ncbi:hypothetical protein EVAR_32217_1 [Eumeta japonica]|uniref:Uncharacterized protein n=1 Tax=Eumeta variegata TaxID=151549 RepID=A0A4C1VXV6_EUMVA|nr:hypothetical protein EVAR_32217_1 [Eumeta japonica]
MEYPTTLFNHVRSRNSWMLSFIAWLAGWETDIDDCHRFGHNVRSSQFAVLFEAQQECFNLSQVKNSLIVRRLTTSIDSFASIQKPVISKAKHPRAKMTRLTEDVPDVNLYEIRMTFK